MTAAFVRQLGAESGVQLNPLKDKSELPTQSISDRVFGIPMRATRGRIDRAFKVHEGNVRKKLGRGEPVRLSALNHAMVHVIEALSQGAYEAVISRLVTPAAKIKWAVCQYVPAKAASGEVAAVPESIDFTVQDDAPEEDFLFAVKHLECFNDGIKLSFRAESAKQSGIEVPVNEITVRLSDKDGNALHEFSGSLVPGALDDNGNSKWLPDVVANLSDDVELLSTTQEVSILPDSAAYGENDAGMAKWAQSDVLLCFDEGGTAYGMEDYQAACKRLEFTPHNFAYISSGGTQAPALFSQLAGLAYRTARQLRFDVPGWMTPGQAEAFVEQINMTGQKEAHLLQGYWAPIKSLDPAGINAKDYFGVATLNIAYACGRNAQVDARGFAPKNYAIAGREWPVSRQGMTQTYTPDNKELSALAKAKINPVIFSEYDGGSRCVFFDSLTCAPVSNSLIMLQNVADMVTHTDEAATRYAKGLLQLPMQVAVKKMNEWFKNYFEGALAAGWIKPSNEPEMKGQAAIWYVRPSDARPHDTMVMDYTARYDGTARAIHATHAVTK